MGCVEIAASEDRPGLEPDVSNGSAELATWVDRAQHDLDRGSE